MLFCISVFISPQTIELQVQVALPTAGKASTVQASSNAAQSSASALGTTSHETHATKSATTPAESARPPGAQEPTVAAVRLPAAPYTLLPGYVSRPQVAHSCTVDIHHDASRKLCRS